jgi:phosphatidylinositol alpha-mannosyltransferase
VKLVLVTEFYYPHLGGVTEHVHHLAAYAARAGHSVRVVTSHVHCAPRRPDVEDVGEGAARYEVARIGRGLPITSNGSMSRVTVGAGLTRRMTELVEGADVVHIQSPLFPMLPAVAIKAARRLGIPVVGTMHTNFGGWDSVKLRLSSPFLLPYTHAIDFPIAVSESAARCARPFLTRPCELIPNGVDVARWGAGRRRPELDDGMRAIAFLGRLDPRNDLEVLLGAFTEVADARQDVRLILIGDGPRRAAIEEALPARLRDRVVLTGAECSLTARADLLASADVMAFTARVVSHPISLTEGLAAGLPVVAYDIEGVRGLVHDGREGFLVAPGDRAALARRFLTILDDDVARRAMAVAARARAAAYDWSIVAERILTVYRRAVAEPTSQPSRQFLEALP